MIRYLKNTENRNNKEPPNIACMIKYLIMWNMYIPDGIIGKVIRENASLQEENHIKRTLKIMASR